MQNLVEDFLSDMGPEVSNKLSSSLGVDKNTVQQMLPAILPMILGGLKKQKDERGGQERVDHILNKYGDPSVLDDIGGLFKNKLNDNATDPNLGGLIGNAGSQVTDVLKNNFKMDSNTAAKLIPMLAPIILGFLSKKRDSGLGSSGLSSFLDQNGDGSILDDVAGLLLGGGSNKNSNPLGNILGGLFGNK